MGSLVDSVVSTGRRGEVMYLCRAKLSSERLLIRPTGYNLWGNVGMCVGNFQSIQKGDLG